MALPAVWCSRGCNGTFCPRRAGVEGVPPSRRGFIPGISGRFVAMTWICPWPPARVFEFSLISSEKDQSLQGQPPSRSESH